MKYIAHTLIYLLFLAPSAMAQQQFDRFDIAVNVENEQQQSAIFNLANTFALLATRTSGERRASRYDFRSGVGLLQSGIATEKLTGAMPEPLAVSVSRLATMGAPCDISRHRFADTDVLLAVHSAEGGQPQDSFRCFMAGLWIYHTGGSDNLSLYDWRVPYTQIITSLVGGQPAFSGFEAEDN